MWLRRPSERGRGRHRLANRPIRDSNIGFWAVSIPRFDAEPMLPPCACPQYQYGRSRLVAPSRVRRRDVSSDEDTSGA